MKLLIVAMGGAVGAAARYAISTIPFKMTFPIGTLITNFIGAFLIGLVVGLAEGKRLTDNSVLFFKTGVCGGFTTFSTFSLEAVTLFENNNIAIVIAYAAASVVLCMLGVVIGRSLVRMAV